MQEEFLCDFHDLESQDYLIIPIEKLKDEFIVLLNEKEEIKIFSSICPHFGGEIIFDKKNQYLTCKWHAYKFSSNDGKCMNYPKNITGLRQYNSLIKEGKVFLLIDE